MTEVATATLVTGDLFFSSQIQGIARSAGVTLTIAPRLPARPGEFNDDLLIVDLELRGLDFDELSALLQTRELVAVGYGSHVKTHLFEAGRNAGIKHLVTRGQVLERLPQILR